MRKVLAVIPVAAALALSTTACFPPVPVWGPGSPGYSCQTIQHTVWLSERPNNVRFASVTVGAYICTQYYTVLLSAAPWISMNKMGFYAGLMNTGTDYVKVTRQDSATVLFEGGVFAQLCINKFWIPVCSFMDHAHILVGFTTPPHIGPNGVLWTVDRGDIEVWSTP